MIRRTLLTAVACASFAHLQLLPVWRELAESRSTAAYFLPLPSATAFVGAALALSAITAVAWLVTAGAARLGASGGRPANILPRGLAAVLVISTLNPLTYNGYPLFDYRALLDLHRWTADYGAALAAAGIAVAAGLALIVWCRPQRVVRVYAVALLALAPFAAIDIGWAAWAVVARSPAEPPATAADRQPAAGRVLWIVFDELDYRAVFEKRPPEWRYPALDTLVGESFVATGATRAAENTLEAMPAMITGRPVAEATPQGPRSLRLRFANTGATADWHQADTLFADVRAMKAATGIVGWFHPYCRVFAGLSRTCEQLFLGTTEVTPGAGIFSAAGRRLLALDPLFRRRNAIEAYRRGLARATAMAADPELDLVFIHIPLPHAPTIYDARRRRFTPYYFARDGYFHNVAAADRFVAAVRAAMEDAGLWEKTAVLVTADHSWRGAAIDYDGIADARIPFVLKLAGPPKAHRHDRPFGATAVKALVAGLLRGQVTTPAEAAARLGETGSRAE